MTYSIVKHHLQLKESLESPIHRGENNGGGGKGHCPPILPLLGKPAPSKFWDLGAKPPKFGAVGAVLENFEQIFEKKVA